MFLKSDGTEIGEGPGVWLDLKNVQEMYQRAMATPSNGVESPVTYCPDQPPVQSTGYSFDTSIPFSQPSDETNNCIIFVHGWNMPTAQAANWSSTVYKRLWWQGYKGGFASFIWPSATGLGLPWEGGLDYNDGEWRAWNYASALKNLSSNYKSSFTVNLIAHSLGNVVASEAVQIGAPVEGYALLDGAASANCYNADLAPVAGLPKDNHPDTASEMGYRGYFNPGTVNLINNFLENDSILGIWVINNNLKPWKGAALVDKYVWQNGHVVRQRQLSGCAGGTAAPAGNTGRTGGIVPENHGA
ncbi:MAG: alpha/beta hydrolase [Methylacidiphilales bacterium]|nr:alpha/beta hydrolase [Candidatus Methylacidiphilales bacterium]